MKNNHKLTDEILYGFIHKMPGGENMIIGIENLKEKMKDENDESNQE